MQKEFLNIDEVLQILNINSKIYLSRYLKKNGIKVLKGKAKPYPKDEILRLAKKDKMKIITILNKTKLFCILMKNSIKKSQRQIKQNKYKRKMILSL